MGKISLKQFEKILAMRGKTMIDFITIYHIIILLEKNSVTNAADSEKAFGKCFPLTYDKKDLLEN